MQNEIFKPFLYLRPSNPDLIAGRKGILASNSQLLVDATELTITRGLGIAEQHSRSGHEEHWVFDVSCENS